MEMEVIMQKLAHVLKTAILFISIYFISCDARNNNNKREIPQTTFAYEHKTLLTANMVETRSGLDINEDGSIVHTGTGQATLRTKIIQPSFSTFHTGSIGYKYNEKAIFSEYRQRVRVHFRLTMDGGETWSDWNEDLNILSTEGRMWDNEPDSLFGWLISGPFVDKLYNGVQVEFVSDKINEGQKIIDVFEFNFSRETNKWFEDRKRHREEAIRKKKRQE